MMVRSAVRGMICSYSKTCSSVCRYCSRMLWGKWKIRPVRGRGEIGGETVAEGCRGHRIASELIQLSGFMANSGYFVMPWQLVSLHITTRFIPLAPNITLISSTTLLHFVCSSRDRRSNFRVSWPIMAHRARPYKTARPSS